MEIQERQISLFYNLNNQGFSNNFLFVTIITLTKKNHHFFEEETILIHNNNQQNKNIVAVSWSGGKDSCLALYKSMEAGYQVKFLLNLISQSYQRCCFHGIERELISLQAQLIDIPLFQKKVSDDMQLYEKQFKEAVTELKARGAKRYGFWRYLSNRA